MRMIVAAVLVALTGCLSIAEQASQRTYSKCIPAWRPTHEQEKECRAKADLVYEAVERGGVPAPCPVTDAGAHD